MNTLKIRIIRADGTVLAEAAGNGFADVVYKGNYRAGDRIQLISDMLPILLHVQMDDAVGRCNVYLTGEWEYLIPFGEKQTNMSPKAFAGNVHYLFAKAVTAREAEAYQNLACNMYDAAGTSTCFPHASANVETRNETVFAARNAIDGLRANLFHGEWPYTSWGINCRDDAEFRLDFGRKVAVDQILLYTRSDFPHDNWWRRVSVSFSDGERLDVSLEKSSEPHVITFEKKTIEWLRLHDLIKSDDPSPFPALTQIEVYGREVSR